MSDEPIAFRDDEARERLAAIADRLLLHDRPIHTRTDDSVVRAVDGRAADAAPLARPRPRGARAPACRARAAGLRGRAQEHVRVAKGARAWVGHHIGDLRNEETLRLHEGIAHFEELFAVTPQVVAHDLHPDYLSTTYALAREGVEHVAVQHHHAHLAAVLAEHGERGRPSGRPTTAPGMGTDGTVWGGESWPATSRASPGPAPCGRCGCPAATARCASRGGWPGVADRGRGRRARAAAGDPARTWHAVAELARTGLAAPMTTSMGRLFDAVAALCGVGSRSPDEGQAAIELEAVADDRSERGSYPLDVAAGVLDARPTVLAVADDIAAASSRGSSGCAFTARSHAQRLGRAPSSAGARGVDRRARRRHPPRAQLISARHA